MMSAMHASPAPGLTLDAEARTALLEVAALRAERALATTGATAHRDARDQVADLRDALLVLLRQVDGLRPSSSSIAATIARDIAGGQG